VSSYELDEIIFDEKEVFTVNTEEFIFKDVFEENRTNLKLPVVQSSFRLRSIPNRSREVLMTFRDGSPFLVKHQYAKGNVYLSSSSLNISSNDLVLNGEVFIPMLYKMAISAASKKPIQYVIGQDIRLEFEGEINLRNDTYSFEGSSEFIPGFVQSGPKSFIDVRDQISNAGDYTFSVNGIPNAVYSFNFDRSESDITTLSTQEIRDQFGTDVTIIENIVFADLSSVISQDMFGKPLWKWCLSLSLLFLMLETILLRFWK
jgi:hypothetical protein